MSLVVLIKIGTSTIIRTICNCFKNYFTYQMCLKLLKVYVLRVRKTAEISAEVSLKTQPWSEIGKGRKSEKRPKPKNGRKVRKTVRKIWSPSVIRTQAGGERELLRSQRFRTLHCAIAPPIVLYIHRMPLFTYHGVYPSPSPNEMMESDTQTRHLNS